MQLHFHAITSSTLLDRLIFSYRSIGFNKKIEITSTPLASFPLNEKRKRPERTKKGGGGGRKEKHPSKSERDTFKFANRIKSRNRIMEAGSFLVIIIWRYTREQLVASYNCRLACGNEEKREHVGVYIYIYIYVREEEGWKSDVQRGRRRGSVCVCVCRRRGDIFRLDQGRN